jgi:hypothetical protein
MAKWTRLPGDSRSAFRISFGTVTWHLLVNRLDSGMAHPRALVLHFPLKSIRLSTVGE